MGYSVQFIFTDNRCDWWDNSKEGHDKAKDMPLKIQSKVHNPHINSTKNKHPVPIPIQNSTVSL